MEWCRKRGDWLDGNMTIQTYATSVWMEMVAPYQRRGQLFMLEMVLVGRG